MESFRIMALVLALTGICLASGAQAATAPKAVKIVTVATDATWPPMEMVDANNAGALLRDQAIAPKIFSERW